MRNLPPLSAIRVFEAAARLENFTLAGRELGMTQAAVSYQVKSLEQRLGAPLFVRARGRAQLTLLGQRLLPPLTQAFDGLAAAFASVRADDQATLTVTTTPTFANTWLAWRLGGFQLAHPDLAVRLAVTNDVVDLPGGEADVAIRAGDGQWPGVEAHLLMPIAFQPMGSPDLLARLERELGRAIRPSDVPRLPLIGREDEWWDAWFAQAGVPATDRRGPGGLRMDSQANEGHAAMAGHGLALLSPTLWQNDLVEGRLVPLFELTATRGYGYWLVHTADRHRQPKVKRFREWILAAVA